MKLGLVFGYWGAHPPADMAGLAQEAERLGFDSVWSAESWGSDAFSPLVWEGNHEYEYIARATTPGNFVVPPPKAEEMYMPETFGRGGSDRVIVE